MHAPISNNSSFNNSKRYIKNEIYKMAVKQCDFCLIETILRIF